MPLPDTRADELFLAVWMAVSRAVCAADTALKASLCRCSSGVNSLLKSVRAHPSVAHPSLNAGGAGGAAGPRIGSVCAAVVAEYAFTPESIRGGTAEPLTSRASTLVWYSTPPSSSALCCAAAAAGGRFADADLCRNLRWDDSR